MQSYTKKSFLSTNTEMKKTVDYPSRLCVRVSERDDKILRRLALEKGQTLSEAFRCLVREYANAKKVA